MTLPNCPECGSEYTYEDRGLLICPECGNEWSKEEQKTVIEDGLVVLDANGNRLSEGDSVTVIKDLKVKGASGAIKQGTKVKNIRLVQSRRIWTDETEIGICEKELKNIQGLFTFFSCY